MNVNFSVKNVPAGVAEQLRLRAERHHRSLQGELLAILEAAAREPLPEVAAAPRTARGRRFEETMLRVRVLFPEPASNVASSTELIRQMRDGRYGEEWAESGRHGHGESN